MMKNELYEAYTDVFNNSLNNMRRIIRIKLKAIRYSNKFMKEVKHGQHKKQMSVDRIITKKYQDNTDTESD